MQSNELHTSFNQSNGVCQALIIWLTKLLDLFLGSIHFLRNSNKLAEIGDSLKRTGAVHGESRVDGKDTALPN